MDHILRGDGRKRVIVLAAVLAVALLAAVAVSASAARATVPFDRKHFIAAIRTASVPEPSDIDTQLFALSNANPRLVWRPATNEQQLAVVAVMDHSDYEAYYSHSGTMPPDKPRLWVTLAPQLKAWCRQFARRIAHTSPRFSAQARATVVRRRVVQRLGLSPTGPTSCFASRTDKSRRCEYNTIVELWVDRSNVLRPCPDPAVGDNRCNLQMDGNPVVKGIIDYRSFYASLYVGAYHTDGAPWTRLGYTYDWGGSNRFGESEYMLTTSTPYDVRTHTTIPQYCR